MHRGNPYIRNRDSPIVSDKRLSYIEDMKTKLTVARVEKLNAEGKLSLFEYKILLGRALKGVAR